MSGSYRRVDRGQLFLLPPSMAEWLPVEHPVWFVVEVVADLDTGVFHRHRVQAGPGRAAFDPDMLVTLLLWASWQGVRSSRQIEARCLTDVAFRIVCAGDAPDHSTISRFRREHAAAFAALFEQVLLLCAREGMGRFGRVAIDGTKIAANASKSANVTVEQVRQIAAAEVAAGLAADAVDERADGGDEPPAGLRDRSGRAARIAMVRAELEAADQAAAHAAADRTRRADRYTEAVRTGQPVAGRRPRGVDPVVAAQARLDQAVAAQRAKLDAYQQARAAGRPLRGAPCSIEQSAAVRHARQALQHALTRAAPSAVSEPQPAPPPRRNLTDPDSRLMPTSNGFIQGYNAQLAVTDDHLIIAAALTNDISDYGQAQPMTRAVEHAAATITERTGHHTTIGTLLFDAGYLSEANLTAPGPDRLIATGTRRDLERHARRQPDPATPPPATAVQTMTHRLGTPEGIATYRRRAATVEPVNGHLKDITALRRFLTRGIHTATGELHLACATLNLRRLFNTITAAATT